MAKVGIYMHPRIIIMKATSTTREKEKKERKLKRETFRNVTEIGYGHFEIISLKDLVLKRKTRGETLMLQHLS